MTHDSPFRAACLLEASPTWDAGTDPVVSGIRTIHIVAGLYASHGGPSYSVPRLCEALAVAGVETQLLSVAGAGGRRCDAAASLYSDRRFPWDYQHLPVLRDLRSSSGLADALYRAAPSADVIHNHGLWLMPNVVAGRAAARTRTPLVVSPRGMLAPAALVFSPARKRAFWHLLQGPAIRGAACLHATSEQEYEEIRGFGLASPVAIIPNGIDLPAASPAPAPGEDRTVLSLGRIHPKKGLDRLIRAWAMLEAKHPGWRLRIIGPGEGRHDDELRALAKGLALSSVSIEGAIYGEAKLAAYRAADLFVLPTLNENFGLTVAEALASGTPAISTTGAPWRGLETHGCGWWIDQGIEPLAAALTTAMALPREALWAMGAKGRAWMAQDFSWDRVAADTIAVYRWLVGAAEPPGTIRLD